MSTYPKVIVLILMLAAALAAQESRGRVQGVVRDPSGAVVAGANVTLSNDNTGVKAETTTNEAGHYLFDLVLPGHYSITVAAPGFKEFVQRNVLVEVGGDLTVDAAVQMGNSKEAITVEAAPVSVEFNTSTMSNSVDMKMADSLPEISRNPYMLVSLDPAVVVRSTTQQEPFHFWAADQFDIGGSTYDANDVILDGSPNMAVAKGGYTPPQDAVQQTSVQQNSVDSEYGHSAGGIIAVITKNGTNEIHGSAYYMNRNPDMSAMSDRTTQTTNLTRQNTYGGTVGAPIRKNKLFTFFAYENIKLDNPYGSRIETLPTAAERTGDFSHQLNTQGNLTVIYDPWTTTTSGSTVTRTPFAGNMIPASRIDPSSAKMMSYLWQPNNPGDGVTGANNSKNYLYDIYPYYNFMDRVDYNITDKLKFFARYSYLHTTEATSDYTGSGSIMRYFQGSTRNALSGTGDLVWMINPTTVFDVHTSYTAINDSFDSPSTYITPTALAAIWPNNWYAPYASTSPELFFPNINITQGGGLQFSSSILTYWRQTPETPAVTAKILKTIGKHDVRVGGEYRYEIVDAVRPIFPGQFTFDAGLTANTYNSPNTALSGNGWATFLLGAMDNTSTSNDAITESIPYQHPRSKFFAIFLQDDYRVNSRLTLNLGLRMEHSGSIIDNQYRLTYDLDLTQPIPALQGANAPVIPASVTALRTSPPIYNGAWEFTDSSHPGAWNTPAIMFEPRLGMAFKINDKTAIRAGWARFIVPATITEGFGSNLLGSVNYDGFAATSSSVAAIQGVPQETLSNPFPNGLVPVSGKSLGTYTDMGNPTINWYDPNMTPQADDRVNFSVQRQLPGKVLLDATYFFQYARNDPYTLNVNLANPAIAYGLGPANGNLTTAKVANPFYNLLPATEMPGTLRTQATVATSALLTPYPQYGTLNQWFTPGAGDHYRALQLSARRAYSNGLTLTFGFNYNHELAQGYYDDLATFQRNLTWIPAQTSKARMTGAAIYELPFGKGRHFMNHVHPVVDGILGGWVVSSLFTYNTGLPIRLGAAVVTGDPAISNPTSSRWFNTSMISVLPAYTERANPVQYSDLVGPRYVNDDMTLSKRFQIVERVKFELRGEFYNALNAFTPAAPTTTIGNSNFGKCIGALAGTSGRQIQVSGRFTF
ncbi:MAG: carboxypeptidase regulatory-like domain-containing protein [Bryobacteraceae bacterium]